MASRRVRVFANTRLHFVCTSCSKMTGLVGFYHEVETVVLVCGNLDVVRIIRKPEIEYPSHCVRQFSRNPRSIGLTVALCGFMLVSPIFSPQCIALIAQLDSDHMTLLLKRIPQELRLDINLISDFSNVPWAALFREQIESTSHFL